MERYIHFIIHHAHTHTHTHAHTRTHTHAHTHTHTHNIHIGCRAALQQGERLGIACVAVCCSVLQCVAVCCSVLQCVAVCCLQCVAVCCLQCVAVCCSVYSVLQHLGIACSQTRERLVIKKILNSQHDNRFLLTTQTLTHTYSLSLSRCLAA